MSKLQDIKLGFIGYGRHARANIYPSIDLLGCNISSVSTRHIESARSAATHYNISSVYVDYISMLEHERLDAVFVVTSADQHFQIVKDCLKNNVHVFVEKPLGLKLQEAEEISAISHQQDKHVMVGFMKRFAPSYEKMRELIPTMGAPISLHGMFGVRSFGSSIEHYLRYAAIHYVDLLRFLLGEINHVMGYQQSMPDGVGLSFAFSSTSNVAGTMFFAGLPTWGKHHEEVTLTGTDGYVKVDNLTSVIIHKTEKQKSDTPRWQVLDEQETVINSIGTSSAGGWQNLYLNGYVGEVNHFLNSVLNDIRPSSSAHDNVRTMKLVELLLESLTHMEQ